MKKEENNVIFLSLKVLLIRPIRLRTCFRVE